jgi:hypothetical protein
MNFFGGDNFRSIGFSLIYAVAILMTQIPSSYFLTYFIIPRFSISRKYVSSFLLWLLGGYMLSVLSRIIVVYGAEPLVVKCTSYAFLVIDDPKESIFEICTDLYKLFRVYFYHTFSVPFVFLTVKLLIDQSEIKERTLHLEKEKISAELKLLKGQLHPHFLFNTLNNIYSLSLDNSPKTSDAIFRLSEILDYILYRSSHPFVPIGGEVQLIENYCGLERLRYDDRLKLSLDVQVKEEVKIAPLILVSIVENAFKHGAGEDTGSPEIMLQLHTTPDNIHFGVTNTIASNQASTHEGRIGLQNIKQQLELIYPQRYSLDISRDEHYFKVHLTIRLN